MPADDRWDLTYV